MTHPHRIALLFLCLVVATLDASVSPRAKTGSVTLSKKLPQTYDEAVRHLIESARPADLTSLKNVPRSDLILFHMGWGMHIRNSLGLWKPHSALLASCAQRVGDSSLHPDGASSLLIKGVWDKLHEGLEWVDFDSVAPERYFEEVRRTIDRAKATREPAILATLPEWVYRQRNHLSPGNDSNRTRLLMERAHRLAKGDDDTSLLALRYWNFHGPRSPKREERLRTLLAFRDRFVELPSYDPPERESSKTFLPPWNDSNSGNDQLAPYHMRRIPVSDFAALCLGSTYGKSFRVAEDYFKWMKLRETNEFVHWSWVDTLTADSLRKLSSNRRRFLEIVALSNRFFRDRSVGLLIELRPASGSAMEAFIDFMGVADSAASPSRADDRTDSGSLFWEPTKASRLGLDALYSLAHSLDRDDLLGILDTASIARYDSAYRTDDLLDYRILGAFLLVSESDRLVRDPDTARVFDLCLGYWNVVGIISWNQKNRLASMLFRIDAKRARELFAPEFSGVPEEGSFARNAILAAMIRHDFQASRPLIERWFWTVQSLDLGHHPSEAKVILDALRSTSDATRELRRKLVRDRRYVEWGGGD